MELEDGREECGMLTIACLLHYRNHSSYDYLQNPHTKLQTSTFPHCRGIGLAVPTLPCGITGRNDATFRSQMVICPCSYKQSVTHLYVGNPGETHRSSHTQEGEVDGKRKSIVESRKGTKMGNRE